MRRLPPLRPGDPYSSTAEHRAGPRLSSLLSPDPDHWYTENELDVIETIDAELALRIDRAQCISGQTRSAGYDCEQPVEIASVVQAIDDARRILAQDGGDIELIGIVDGIVRVRMKGACAGCPNAALDLRNVVERIVRSQTPGVRSVVNEF